MRTLYVGIDLGTTNSTAVVFDGDNLHAVRSSAGSTLTPSVVRINAKGQAVVGERARRALESDPDNTFTGFKRMLGSQTTLRAAASGKELSPVDLSAEVLKALLHDVTVQTGTTPTQAIITVPALFEVPQSTATAQAALLAGLERVELLQEPVASALAAGFRADSDGLWMVYDLGGGTFDVSLVQGEQGLLRVVGHDGDNFLGGRDFDQAIVGYVIDMLGADGFVIERKNPAHQSVLRQLAALAEDAKIELTRNDDVTITSAAPLMLDGVPMMVDVPLPRHVLERLVAPLVDRSVQVCQRLLQQHNLQKSDVSRVVLVGGPTGMPLVRQRVAEQVGPLAAEALDPMTLVAQGAALHAAASGLPMVVQALVPRAAAVDAHRLLVQAPTMSTDLMPFVVVRLVDKKRAHAPTHVRLRRVDADDSAWSSPWTPLDADGTAAIMAELVARKGNEFRVDAQGPSGQSVDVDPDVVRILHGATVGDPPVSRTLGVALADNTVRVFIEKGTPLPTKRTFTLHTLRTAVGGGQDETPVMTIPLVQGEHEDAHLCRLVGRIDVRAKDIPTHLPAGSAVEVTLELDRGGRLHAQAFLPSLKQVITLVEHLVVPEASLATLSSSVVALLERIASLRQQAHALSAHGARERMESLLRDQQDAERAVDRARGGDAEQAQRARRLVLDLDARLTELESEAHWPEVNMACLEAYAWASRWVADQGTPAEQKVLDDTLTTMQRALQTRQARDVERHKRIILRVGNSAFLRSADAYRVLFDDYASYADQARDVRRAEQLVQQGRAIVRDGGDNQKLKPVVDELADLLPPSLTTQRRAFDSGVRG
jgi:molecular chaperone DnaK